MKTAESDFARTLPSLLITATISAGCVIALAVIHSLVMGEVSQPPKKVASARKSPPASMTRQEVPVPEKPDAVKPRTETNRLQPPAANSANATASAKSDSSNSESVQPPAAKTLQDLRAEYERERAEFRQAVAADLALRETAARESAVPEALKRATDASAAFAQGMIPNDAPEPALTELLSAREELVAALQAAALDKELTEFQAQESADVGNVIHRFPKCIFRLINLETGLALAAKSTGRGSAVIQAKEDPANLMQHWYVTYPTKPYSRVKNRGSKTVLNVPAGNRAGGVKIILWEDKHSDFNFWELQYRGPYYHVRSRFSGKLLSVPAAKNEEGLQLIQWPHHEAPDDQKWKLIRVLTDGDES